LMPSARMRRWVKVLENPVRASTSSNSSVMRIAGRRYGEELKVKYPDLSDLEFWFRGPDDTETYKIRRFDGNRSDEPA